ncbi:hypothetical protein AHF37_00944 [Paragonimus kellicotti]|nr:hypothetical protein AHF37_00944 [Paragonimus kellicotti]
MMCPLLALIFCLLYYFPLLQLVVKGTVFARFSPDQKTQLIEALQSVGYFVAMCGDGANDCGALKAAHAGISLSEAEASVASPFTSKSQHIGCVPTLIRQGRCALVTSFGTFKFMSGYSLVQFFTTILLYTLGSTITDGQFLFIDLFLITTLSVTYGYTRAYSRLSVEPPSMHLLSTITFMSLGFQLFINCTLQVICFIWVRAQPWYLGSTITDGQFLFIDLFLITTLSVTYGYTRAYSRLSVEPPSMHLLSTITFMSLGFQLFINCTLQVICFIWVRAQPWYIPLYEISYAYELKNYETTVVFMVSVYQYIILAIVFSKGAPYRRSIFTNYFFICNLIGCIGLTLYVTTYPADPILNLLAMVRIPSIRFILILHGVVLANFLACYILELIVDGVSFRRRLLHIRRALFPRHIHMKDYERIREEIDRLAGSWPPIIRSASVQALPRELFHDGEALTAQTSDGHVRKRTVSGASSDSEDELVSPVRTDCPIETALLQSSPPTQQHANVEFTVGGTTGADPCWKSSRRRRFNSGKLRRPKSLTDLHWESILSGRPVIKTSKASEPSDDAFDPESDISFQPICPTTSLRQNILVDKRKRSQSSGPCADPVYLPVRGHWTGHDRASVKRV